MTAIEFYNNVLRIYGHRGIPRFHRSKSFVDRIDEYLVMLVNRCTYLSTLVSIWLLINEVNIYLLWFISKTFELHWINGKKIVSIDLLSEERYTLISNFEKSRNPLHLSY